MFEKRLKLENVELQKIDFNNQKNEIFKQKENLTFNNIGYSIMKANDYNSNISNKKVFS